VRADAIKVQQQMYKVMIDELEEQARAHAERSQELDGQLAAAQRELGDKDGLIAAVEHEAGAARSQLVETEATLERKNVDVAQLTGQLQVCILELKALSEKSREAQHKQRHVFDGAKALGAARALSLQGSGFE
jgi:chromosome segregation ATPase